MNKPPCDCYENQRNSEVVTAKMPDGEFHASSCSVFRYWDSKLFQQLLFGVNGVTP